MSARCIGSTMSITKDLSKCTPEEVKNFLNSFDIMLSDCDGVLWHVDGQLGGVAESLNRLHGMKKDVYLVTNNSTFTLQEQCNLLRKRGVEIKEELIINTAKVIVWYLQRINFQGDVYAIGSPTFTKYFIEAGMRLTPYPVLEENNVSKTIREIRDRPSVKAVVIDFDVECNWSKLALALSCLMRDDVLYLTGAMDDWGTSSDAIRILGPGPLTRVVTNQSGREPIECAKPSGVLKDYIYEICKVTDPRRCLFVGDTVNQDMKFGRMCEFQKLFVGTGCDKLEDAQKMPDTSPEYFIPSFGDLHSVIDRLSHNNSTSRKDA